MRKGRRRRASPKGARLYKRGKRFYGDFRSYGEVGGREEALVASGEKLATTDPVIAAKLLANRLGDLEAARRGRVLYGVHKQTRLAELASNHLVTKAKSGTITDQWLAASETFLGRAVEYFGTDRDLMSIQPADIRTWTEFLGTISTPRRRPLSTSSVRHHLNALSNLYRRAQAEGFVPPGFNPVAALMEKPRAERREAEWLEVPDAALLLESARTLPPPSRGREGFGKRMAYPLIATFLLTGGRSAEVLGLEVSDVSLDRRTVTFRPNKWRRLKTLTSARVVPLWPQLEEILRSYIFERPPRDLLFPASLKSGEAMVTDIRKMLDRIAVRAGWTKGEMRTKIFRHTYCAARLQTLDGGHPVSPFTVSRELGHGSREMVERTYGHLGMIRHRSDVVEYQVEHHRGILGDRLAALGEVQGVGC